MMRILALEPYYGGSHKAFLDGWSSGSKHDWTIIQLPAYKWKWRMRHASVTMSQIVTEKIRQGDSWDILFCSDMLSLAELTGLSPKHIHELPKVIYFHENQLSYTDMPVQEIDYHFGFTNFLSATAANEVWFNSKYHFYSFTNTLYSFLKRMPDYNHLEKVDTIKAKSRIVPQGILPIPKRTNSDSPLPHILWSARWDQDKNPEHFFEILYALKNDGIQFKLSVIGEQFKDCPDIFNEAKEKLSDNIVRWGYQPDRAAYEQAVAETNIVISTANHEFFGVSVIEAISAGLYPLLPNRLSYPEILQLHKYPENIRYFYDGTVQDAITVLKKIITDKLYVEHYGSQALSKIIAPYVWESLRPTLDSQIENCVSTK